MDLEFVINEVVSSFLSDLNKGEKITKWLIDFSKDKISFYLMTPYLAWSSYALILNCSIFLLN